MCANHVNLEITIVSDLNLKNNAMREEETPTTPTNHNRASFTYSMCSNWSLFSRRPLLRKKFIKFAVLQKNKLRY